MVLLVELRGLPYIADVGFGGNVLTAPLRLEPHIAQPTPHEPHRLLPIDHSFMLEACLNGEWKPFYRFTLEPQFPSDYEVSNWYLCNHPNSFFRHSLLGARALPEGRYALWNNALAIHRKEGTEKRRLETPTALRSCLEEDFGIRLPEAPELNALLERISQISAEATSA
jgi:N-hydroxyarylamine O-acetyltransferase